MGLGGSCSLRLRLPGRRRPITAGRCSWPQKERAHGCTTGWNGERRPWWVRLTQPTDRLVRLDREEIFATIIDACALHLGAPREVNVLLSDRTMQTWDSMFLDNLARDAPELRNELLKSSEQA